ncbi:MAG: lipid A biosynthesis [SAR116 cluster bacterium MED-G04]|jgi:lipid-A-disaccharide synthase-like uncharacterized protein|nr:lipid A biosynthesis [SAR116 cluster bacterium]OUW37565.1 MAG: lipid A biosynthesis [Gammaproteobacteria bacterium TMED183]PDH65942.1 MAG: lipid A biosynthesis [SAR116 cluster bacterium MED-G04]HCD49297.1 lipid A biosynthesis [Alphaproteobacteria bacterium]CAI8421187.1 MAG: Uncharacterised protein [SAR116 cluster bacterium MED-G04]|tara:strand:+ start:11213 stop:11602 length:390 start_codon:yes stop_codon:yes gene_type:complete
MVELIRGLSAGIENVAVAVSTGLVYLFPFLPETLPQQPETVMIAVGFGGQLLFAMRFIVQWITSEGAKRSVIPVMFWYFSIGGGMVLLLYAIWRQDPVIICGQGLGLLIYARNLIFIFREKNEQSKTDT